MKVRCALRLSSLVAPALSLGCSTPISFEPQVMDEEEVEFDAGGQVDAGNPIDGGGRDAGDAGRDTGASPLPSADCELYEGPFCPTAQPRDNTLCEGRQEPGFYCYYRAQAEGQVQVAECRRVMQGSKPSDLLWEVSPARCAYRCGTDLPQGGNFFSLLTDGCTTRPVTNCHASGARTSQEGVDLFLRDFVTACGLRANFQLGVTFNAQGCAEWAHYQAGPRLNAMQNQCLTQRLEAVRFDCDVSCALTPSATR